MIRKSLPFLLLILAVNIALFSCKKPDERPAPLPVEQKYYPLEKGKWIIYDVDSTIWDDTFCVERFYNYQIRHYIADTFTNERGVPSYRVETSIRRKVEEPFVSHRVFYATNTGVTLETVQDQARFIKLVFPVEEGRTWEGNNYIPSDDPQFSFYDKWVYEYQDVEQSFNTGLKVFDNTVSVEQIDEAVSDPELFPLEFASRTSSREVYAADVGLIYREFIRWTYDPNGTECRKGVGVVMRAVDHN